MALSADDCDELPFVIDKTGAAPPISTPSVPAVDRRKSTVFVRNLPFDFTDDHLLRKFEEVGPVKRAFIVTGKKSKQGSRGFGFVIYADENDAADAAKQLHNTELSGRKIKVELAREPGNESAAAGTAQATAPAPRPKRVRRRRFSKKKPVASNTDVLLEGIDAKVTSKQLEKKVRKFGPVSIFDYPAAESTAACRVARVTFSSAETARKAVRHLDRKELVVPGSEPIRAGWADLKCARVILRNIPFNCKEPRLKTIMKLFGKIQNVHLPKDPEKGGDCNKGFCFVQFEDLADATKAVEEGAVKLGGRTVAIDWALSKAHYESHQGDDDGSDAESDAEQMDAEPDSDVDDINNVYCEGDDHDDGDDDDDDADHDDDDDIDDDGNADDDDADNDCKSEMEEGSDQDDTESESEDDAGAKSERDPSRPSLDVQEQRSVFVRNVPFEASEAQLKQLFSRFGQVKSVMIVMDREIGKPKGCAFIQFDDSSAATEAVRFASAGWSQLANRMDKTRRLKSASDQGLQLGGRTLDVTLAVDRSQAIHLQNENSKLKKDDKKQAYLAKEGYINPESDSAKGLTKIDLALRSKLYKETTKKLQNPNYVMSRYRLSIHNLPDGVIEKNLKSHFIQAVKQSNPTAKPIVKQCIIVRDKNVLDKDGKPRSRHYGFIEFSDHNHALAALRALNNKPNGLGPKTHRLIVMFAVDDMRKLAMRKARLAKSQQKLKVAQLQRELTGQTRPAGKKRPRRNEPQAESSRPRKKFSKK